ncbi:MAG TPA: Ppx/GppA family phosphatase [Thermoanaerobacterales bacterium]|nr:Ppx/GppA family phosphatase [Thermoanaerobacterales bacterium]
MRVGVIDIGSNSVRLMVADYIGRFEYIHRDIITTRLGRGVSKESLIDQDSIDKTLSAIQKFKLKARDLGCMKIFLFSTSAIREAKNGHEFINLVKNKLGLETDVISGQEEAQLSFLGATYGLPIEGQSMVIDIGGGSTEISLGYGCKTGKACEIKTISLPIGAVRWTSKFIFCDPPHENEMKKAKEAAERKAEEMADFYMEFKMCDNVSAIGVGGTWTSLAAIDQQLKVYDPNKVHGYCLYRENVEKIFKRLLPMDKEMRKKIPGLAPQRADIITAGALIALEIMDKLKLDFIKTSESDIMEGYIIKKLSL